ncbi:hypothetical protein [Pradoshia sp. D12]|uniref:hypothetical protein n=2 Tax=Bacillaceae TaxID=186817 RepID=UPI00178C3C36|nr:hypothetical protein [Pradoshia sp. D12]
MLILLLFIFFLLDLDGQTFFNKIDITVFLAVVIAIIVNSFNNSLSRILRQKLEDWNKLSDDYKRLIKQYPSQKMVSYKNPQKKSVIHRIRMKSEQQKVFPIILESMLIDSKIKIEDTKKQYELPEIIKENYETIMQAHEFSDVYNQLNIRLDDYNYNKNLNELTLKTSRTTFFDSLVTNRAMDFKWGLKSTNRELLEFGPFVNPLSESKLSNHLGFNGFIETSDHKIIFVNRSNNVSIGKGTLGNSVAASLKTMYALNNEERTFTPEGLLRSMILEIDAELKIKDDCFEFSTSNIIAIYRDLVEGGKPQLLFYVKVNKTTEEVNDNFKKAHKRKEKNHLPSKLSMDGDKLVFIDRNKLTDLFITPEMIVFEGKSYLTMPSASAAIVILINYLKERKRLQYEDY